MTFRCDDGGVPAQARAVRNEAPSAIVGARIVCLSLALGLPAKPWKGKANRPSYGFLSLTLSPPGVVTVHGAMLASKLPLTIRFVG